MPTATPTIKRKKSSQEKRARTREQIVEAGLLLLAKNKLSNTSILEVATTAGVSNGTFYNYFDSKKELVEAVAYHLSDRLAGQLRKHFLGVEDPAERIVIAARTFMQQAYQEPDFGWALLRLMGTLPKLSEIIRLSILFDLREGQAQGRFRFSSESAAMDLVLGTLIAGIRSLLEGREQLDHINHISEISLVGLGMPIHDAQKIVAKLNPARPAKLI
ncbi:TetR/AcrR family transcriptional regulator [Ketobacter sp.]